VTTETPANALPPERGAHQPVLSVVLNVMGRVELADYGFRSWMVQETDQPYEVVLNLFNDFGTRFEEMAADRSPMCDLLIRRYDRPAFFNISAANNLGLHASRGRFVMFANSDVAYPPDAADTIMREATRRDLHYVMCSRGNLTDEQTKALPPAKGMTSHDMRRRFGDLEGLDVWWATQGWIARRDDLFAIGGFDHKVRVAEDNDLTDRMTHYLRRRDLQSVSQSLTGLLGYHLYHPTSELFDTYSESIAIIKARRAQMKADPNSNVDSLPTPLNDLAALKDAMAKTPKPPPMVKYRQDTLRKVVGRVGRAWNVLIGRRQV
jgi:hypothetical protein